MWDFFSGVYDFPTAAAAVKTAGQIAINQRKNSKHAFSYQHQVSGDILCEESVEYEVLCRRAHCDRLVVFVVGEAILVLFFLLFSHFPFTIPSRLCSQSPCLSSCFHVSIHAVLPSQSRLPHLLFSTFCASFPFARCSTRTFASVFQK